MIIAVKHQLDRNFYPQIPQEIVCTREKICV